MNSELKLASFSAKDTSKIEWSEVIKKTKELIPLQFEEILGCDSEDVNGLKSKILDKDVILVDPSLRTKISKIVNHRSVKSHFLQYFDYLEKRDGAWWGYSLYSEIFHQILLSAIKNQDYKGSVIFLGVNSLVFPIVEVLTGFGFTDFVFLNCSSESGSIEESLKTYKGFIGAQFSTVDSTTFIQSQKEYSLCFVMDDVYSTQILDDMSYFHFLSTQSMVFDIASSSNFLFKEVKALGVDVVSSEQIQERLNHIYHTKITQYARDIGVL